MYYSNKTITRGMNLQELHTKLLQTGTVIYPDDMGNLIEIEGVGIWFELSELDASYTFIKGDYLTSDDEVINTTFSIDPESIVVHPEGEEDDLDLTYAEKQRIADALQKHVSIHDEAFDRTEKRFYA